MIIWGKSKSEDNFYKFEGSYFFVDNYSAFMQIKFPENTWISVTNFVAIKHQISIAWNRSKSALTLIYYSCIFAFVLIIITRTIQQLIFGRLANIPLTESHGACAVIFSNLPASILSLSRLLRFVLLTLMLFSMATTKNFHSSESQGRATHMDKPCGTRRRQSYKRLKICKYWGKTQNVTKFWNVSY